MIIYDGKIVHPLRRSSVKLGDKTIFERPEKTGRAWFVIDLALPAHAFVPSGSTGLRTADGAMMMGHSRRK